MPEVQMNGPPRWDYGTKKANKTSVIMQGNIYMDFIYYKFLVSFI